MNFVVVLSFVTLQCFYNNIVIGQSISKKKCDEYRNKFPQSSEVINDDNKYAMPKEFPFMVIVVHTTTQYQNGILISEKFVLTASYDSVAEYVILGNLAKGGGAHSQHFGVSKEFTHHHFRSDLSFDLKLLMLKDTVQFNQSIQPACLPEAEPAIPQQLLEIGWSTTNILYDKLLHRVKLDYVRGSRCQKLKFIAHQEQLMKNVDDETIFCAITSEGGRDMCDGFPGSVLLNRNRNSSTSNEVIGFAISNTGCSDTYPTVFFRISASLSWIESVVWSDETTSKLRSTTTNYSEPTTETILNVDTTAISTATTELPSATKNSDHKVILINIITITIISLILGIVVACCQLKRTKNHQEINFNIQIGQIPDDNRVIVK